MVTEMGGSMFRLQFKACPGLKKFLCQAPQPLSINLETTAVSIFRVVRARGGVRVQTSLPLENVLYRQPTRKLFFFKLDLFLNIDKIGED